MSPGSSPTTVDEYIAGFPKDVQKILKAVRAVVSVAAPDAQERIAYQMPTYTMGKNLAHFAAFKNHIGFYPTPNGISSFEKQLSKYKRGKGSVQFPIDKPMPLALIKRMVEYRVKEQKKKNAKPSGNLG
jgi:uncharacterized protein YdhG (YjbR/CyaY superfamily)